MADNSNLLVVVDTNVPLCANGKSHVTAECVKICSREIKNIKEKGCIVLDDGWRIVKEYKNKLSSAGKPGVGDAFLKWVLTNMQNSKRCRMVRLTPRAGDENHFHEFPCDTGLKDFDPSDRKFVAAAAAHPEHPPVLQAADSKWWGWQKALNNAGIRVVFLCPDEIREKYDQKFKHRDTD
jgi:hypothetical protein